MTGVKKVPTLDLYAGYILPLPSTLASLDGRRVMAGVRPEHFELGAPEKPAIPAIVEVIEPLGSSTQVALSANGQHFIATFNERLACRAGGILWLLPQHDHLHLFEAETGQRITLHE